MAAREQDKRRAEIEAIRQQIEIALEHQEYTTALAAANEGLRRFPQEQSLVKLKAAVDAQRLRVEQKKFVREQFSAANSLADSGQLRQAVAVLERALQRAPGNGELESLRANFLDRLATEQAGQRREQSVNTALAEGERILQERGAREAADFLEAQSTQYSDSPRFREFYDSVRERGALEALDSTLAGEPNPRKQLQLTEEALRQNPNNRWIQQRVADLHQLRDQVNAVIERAQAFAAADRFAEAIQLWQQLSEAYPQFPEFTAEIRRLEIRRKVPPAAVEPHLQDKPAGSLSATQMIDLTEVEKTRAGTVSGPPRTAGVPEPRKIEPPPVRMTQPRKPTLPEPDEATLFSGSKRYIVLASVVIVLIAVGYLIFGGAKKTAIVKITTDPTDADVTVGIQRCHAPCDLRLAAGEYDLRAEREGYQSTTKKVAIAANTKSLRIALEPETPPLKPAVDKGTLAVDANVERAEVFIDGSFKGLTDSHKKYEEQKIDVGPHTIVVKKSGFDDSSEQVEIAEGRTLTAVFTLKEIVGKPKPPEPAYLHVRTKPGGARVFVDGQFIRETATDGSLFLKVEAGRRNVEARKDGYTPWSGSATAEPGKTVSISAELPENPKPKPVISFFNPSTSSIELGESVLLNWQTQNANDVSIDPIGSVQGATKEVRPTKTTIYTLIAKGPGGMISSDPITIIVHAPLLKVSIDDFEPGQDSIQSGQSTKLFWHTQNAKAVSITADPGPDIGPVSESPRTVKPSQTTTYTVHATGQGGDEQTMSRKVTVIQVPGPTGTDAQEIRKCMDGYHLAYLSMDFNKMLEYWPSAPEQLKGTLSSKEILTIIVKDDCQGDPSIDGDTAHWQCAQTMKYKATDKPKQVMFEFVFRKSGGRWVIDKAQPRK